MSIAKVEYLNPPGACPPRGLYSHVGRIGSGRVPFVAGQAAVDGRVALLGVDRPVKQEFPLEVEAVVRGSE